MAKRKKFLPIKSLAQLKKLANKDGGEDFFILLNYGCRSSKHISYDGETFYVLNEIDDSECTLTEKDIMDKKVTLIGEAISKGAFFRY